jgi:glycosyltransferase EpsH
MGLGLNIIAASNSSNFSSKVKQIRQKLSVNYFTTALQKFESSNMPFHWRVFYSFAKNQNAICYYFMLRAIRFMISASR